MVALSSDASRSTAEGQCYFVNSRLRDGNRLTLTDGRCKNECAAARRRRCAIRRPTALETSAAGTFVPPDHRCGRERIRALNRV
jgi:hypothetical protein